MERAQIYQELTEMIPDLRRREATPRVMAPVDVLLDQLIELNMVATNQQIAGIESALQQ